MRSMQRNGILVFSLLVSLTACGNDFQTPHLNDDPTQELPAAGTGSGPETVSPAPEDSLAVELTPPAKSPTEKELILAKYDHLDPNKIVPSAALEKAVLYYDQNLEKLGNKNYLSVINFGRSSKEKRFFIVNMKTGAVEAIRVAHGKGSDSNHDGMAERFSNVSGSNASSLGFYVTAETYYGQHGLSLRLDGKSSTNSQARSRAIVIHGASYVRESNVIQGRSWGCPAVAMNLRDRVVQTLKGGALIYALR